MIVLAAALGGCAPRLAYVRTDGSPIDKTQEAAMLAQCKGERATISTSDQGTPEICGRKNCNRRLHGAERLYKTAVMILGP
jgi:hypothetical protein